MILPGSVGGLWESSVFTVLIGVQQNPSPFSLGGYTGKSPVFGAEEVSHPLYGYFWAARMDAVDFHPLCLPDSTCVSSYSFFQA